jgi:hypothetical protein
MELMKYETEVNGIEMEWNWDGRGGNVLDVMEYGM